MGQIASRFQFVQSWRTILLATSGVGNTLQKLIFYFHALLSINGSQFWLSHHT
jgi:hypothetical protein